MGCLPASAQHTCPEEESYVRALGRPTPSVTTTLRFCPSTDALSIFGASRFQSVQYRVLRGHGQDGGVKSCFARRVFWK